MKCTKCKTSIPKDAEFCPKCGTKKEVELAFCPNCGTKLTNETVFCPNCGKSVGEIKATKESMSNDEIADMVINKTSNFFKKMINCIKSFVSKNKKALLIASICLVLVIGILIAYKSLFGFEKFAWDKNYKDIDLKYTSPSKLSLGIIFNNDKKLSDITYDTNCGVYRLKGKEVNWDLQGALGKCEITAKYKLRKIKKNITVISDVENHDLAGFKIEKIDVDSDDDTDYDGLTNKEEKQLKTNPKKSDTDDDGLEDGYEINESKTDPLKKDTDGDGLNDYDEIQLGLDPLKKDSKGDGVNDGDRLNTYTYEEPSSGVNLEMTGKGNIAEVTVNAYINKGLSKTNGIIDKVYNLYTKGKLQNAKLTIPYNVDELYKYSIEEEELSVYYFNDKTKGLEPVESEVNVDNKTITANLKHFSKYVLGRKDISLDIPKNKVLMVIDNSISMYTEDQLIDLGYENITGADGNDSNFKRLDLTKSMIDMFSENYYCSISEFAGSYVNLKSFTNDFKAAKNSVSSIKNDVKRVGNGTNINKAISSGIKEFSNDGESHYMILLTDGLDTSGLLSSNKNDLIKEAQSKDVHICVIGLGDKIDSKILSEIATSTGCNYYSADTSGALDEIYSLIGADINYNLVDVDKDGKSDGTIIADSGFVVSRDGFSFPNYGTNLSKDGHCYGMALFTELYYKKELPFSEGEYKTKKGLFSDEELTSYPYNITDSYLKNYNNLYGYKLKSNILKYTFGFPALGEVPPKDLKIVSKDTLMYNTKYLNEIKASGIYDLKTEETGLSAEEQKKKYGMTYKYTNYGLLNEDYMQKYSSVDYNDKQLLNVIYRYHISQHMMPKISSTSNILKEYNHVMVGIFSGLIGVPILTDNTRFIDLIITRVENGEVPYIGGDFTGNGGHAINVISVAQDNTNETLYHLGVYDSNYPGEKRYLTLACSFKNCDIAANAYYENAGETVYILPASLSELIKVVY